MKYGIRRPNTVMGSLFAMMILLFSTGLTWAQNNDETANVQIIHNAADPAVEVVDIWLNGESGADADLEDVEFRSATEFLEIPSGQIEVAIGPAGEGYDNALTFDIEPSEDGNYVLIANGVVDPDEFADNPEGIEINLELFARDEARTEATEDDDVDFFAGHGATDAPEVGIYERGGLEIASAASYGDLTGYLSVPADEYIIDITEPNNPDNVLFEIIADFNLLAGEAAAVLASGFLNPSDNQDGPGFGLLVAASNGTTLFLEAEEPVERTVSFRTQALDLTADDTEVVVENVTSADGDYVVITTNPEDGDFEGAQIVGFTQVGELDDESVAVDVEGAEPVDHVAHVVSNVSEESLNEGSVSEETLGNVQATSEAAAVYAVTEFIWEDETSTGPASSVTIDAIEILYQGEIGDEFISIDLHEVADGSIGAFVGISQMDLSVNERHVDVVVDIVEAIDPQDDNPQRVDAAIEEDGEFFAMAHLGEAGEDGDGNRIPAQRPALLTSDNTSFVPLVGDFAMVTIEASVANAQIIHNAADPAVDEVDVWVNGELTLEEFGFRDATPFVEIPAGDVEVAIGPAGSDLQDAFTFDLQPSEGGYYTLIASGVVDPEDFADNPDDLDINLDVLARGDGQTEAADEENFDFFVGHNVTDAPSVGLAVDGSDDFLFDISSAGYGDLTDYGSVPADQYLLNLTAADDIDEVLLQFDVDVSGLAGESAAVLASGFLDPSANQDGESFALLVALADGTTLTIDPVEEAPVANAQIIHNAADPAVDEVDVWVNGELTLEEFGFRDATPFVEIPAGDVEVAIGPAGSDLQDAFTFDLQPSEGGYYTLIASGVVDPEDFAENPDEMEISLDIFAKADARTEAEDEDEIDFFVSHGVTDAPAVDVRAREADVALVENAAYGDITDYISVEPATYRLDITLPGESDALFSFLYDFEDLAGSSAAIIASGFVDPDANQNGEAFTLLAVLADGTVVEAQNITSSEDELVSDTPQEYRLNNNYPNPFNPTTNIEYQLPESQNVRLAVYDVLGREVAVLVNEEQQAGTYTVAFDGADLSSGTYIYRITAGSFSETGKMMLVK